MLSDESKSTLAVSFIKNLLNVLGRGVGSTNPKPATKARLNQILHAERAAIPQAALQKIVWSMSRRWEA